MNDRAIHRDALPPGSRVHEFELLDVLGRGGFGITYLGRNNLNIQVAIKEYMPLAFAVRDEDGNVCPRTDGQHGDYEWGLGKFLDEAQLLARFDRHPNIVQVRQFFEAHDTAYMVMEFLNGRTLYDEFETEGTLSEERLRDLLTPILFGLEQVHVAGAWHMDIKPGNIVLRDDVTPVLIDFGAAEIAVAEHSRLVQQIVMPGFSPSEQYSSSTLLHGPWTDIYALGAVTYRGMTGSVPIDALLRVQGDELVPVGEAAKRRYSPSLVDAVDWALRVNAKDRPQSIDEWRKALGGGRKSSWTSRRRKHVPDLPPRPKPRPPAESEPPRHSKPRPPAEPTPPRHSKPGSPVGARAGAPRHSKPPTTPKTDTRTNVRYDSAGRNWQLGIAFLAAIVLVVGVGYLVMEPPPLPPTPTPTPTPTPPPTPTPTPTPTPGGAPAIPSEAAEALTRAEKLRGEGELSQAREELKKARERGLPEEHYGAELGEIEKAERTIRECEAFRDDNRFADAEACYRRLLGESTPENAEARYEMLYHGIYAALRAANEAETRAAYERFIDELTRKMDEYRRVDLQRGTELEDAATKLIGLAKLKLSELSR